MSTSGDPAPGDPVGLDLAALDRHLVDAGIARRGPLRAHLLTGGRSNLTFRVDDDASSWVLRRPPLHGLTPSAHDMGREHRVVAALAGTDVPVAPAVTVGGADSALGVPFALTAWVEGRVVRTGADMAAMGDAVDGCVDALVAVLARLHAVDPGAVGLADFGRPPGYLARQVRRWGSQWDFVRLPDDPRDADARRLHDALAASVPATDTTGVVAVVHGDYRIDNTIVDAADPTRVLAVLDWEMSTLGDPLSDAALMCVYRDPTFAVVAGADAAWTSPVMPSAADLAHRYSLASGRPLDHWPFFMALAYFKLAVIAAGVEFRLRLEAASSPPDEASDRLADSWRVGAVVGPLVAAGLSSAGAS